MFTKNNIYSKIKFFLIYKFNIDKKKIKKKYNFNKNFGEDSIDILEFIILLEKEFNINIDYNNDNVKLNTIEDYINYIYKKI
ncbi:acyl carrier protein [Candidatus Shikimatogenerans silvanidophilus]|uniref:acyl carrier protein n=1 Tax=Candidatus Shikimatogenerans silvanidophilus TaxID=2782547 RepID=UPI001BAB84C4|nr:acyl carrier protein [Candidatus Shikimatogenerans silvanidophilus]